MLLPRCLGFVGAAGQEEGLVGLNNRRATRRDPIWVQAERAGPFFPPSTLLLADVCQVHRAGSALLAEKIAAGAAVAAA